MNSRNKGKRGELELAAFLSNYGLTARRGQQFKGTSESPDVQCDELSHNFHIECKRTERLNLYSALEQATDEKENHQWPIVFHRRNRKNWVVIMDAEDFMDLLRTGSFI